MFLLGITGSIGMGKSTVARQLKAYGINSFDADKAVHKLLSENKETIAEIEKQFSGVIEDGKISRKKLGEVVFRNPEKIPLLEKILHPEVRRMESEFIKKERRAGRKIVAVEIPLLFETKSEKRLDAVAVATAPHIIQRQRVVNGRGISEEKLKNILSRQIPDAEKRKRADFIINTGNGKFHSLRQIERMTRKVKGQRGKKWPVIYNRRVGYEE